MGKDKSFAKVIYRILQTENTSMCELINAFYSEIVINYKLVLLMS